MLQLKNALLLLNLEDRINWKIARRKNNKDKKVGQSRQTRLKRPKETGNDVEKVNSSRVDEGEEAKVRTSLWGVN